jgi:hypothetical protein
MLSGCSVEENAIQGEMKGYHPQNSSGNCRGKPEDFAGVTRTFGG